MPDEKGNLYVFEAIELRNEYDRHIKLAESLIQKEKTQDRLYQRSEDEEKEPAAGFDQTKLQEQLKTLLTKRVKINQAIQISNFESMLEYEGERVSVSELLEIRKHLMSDIQELSQRVRASAYNRIIHKEERDIVHKPHHSFIEAYEDYQNKLKKFRRLITQIHRANHANIVKYKDE